MVLALAAAAGARAQDAAAAVGEEFRRGRFDAALATSEDIEDPVARAEWRFHILYTGGDLGGALAAALEGLRVEPEHAVLLGNAAVCATSLGRGMQATQLCERWIEALERGTGDSQARASELARAAPIHEQARRLAEADARASSALRTARGASAAGLIAAAALLVAFARRA